MPAYLDLDGFRALTMMPSSDVDARESTDPGWLLGQLEHASRKMDTLLAKRYAVPFEAPAPLAIRDWLTSIVTFRAYFKRGIDPSDPMWDSIKEAHDTAWAELKEAADSDAGLFELPLRADTSANGVSKGGPYGYSEASPYVWTDVQAGVGRSEDRNRGGSYG